MQQFSEGEQISFGAYDNKRIIMIYGHLQYYNDELRQWVKIVSFYKEQVQELTRQVNVILTFPVISLPNLKAGNALLDRLIVHEQQFEHLLNNIAKQARSLKTAIVSPDGFESTILDQQKNLRVRIRSYELIFGKTKSECSAFLSSFFEFDSLAIHA